jgi:Protein of unknown function (DUF2793)
MAIIETARHKLPLLVVSQAQKEITHNEALVRVDALLHPVIVDELSAPPATSDLDIGKCWLVGASPIGEWSGKVGQIAIWIGGGWRFCVAVDGMRIRLQSAMTDHIRSGETWIAAPAIANAANGSVIDVEARAALNALLHHLRAIGHVSA